MMATDLHVNGTAMPSKLPSLEEQLAAAQGEGLEANVRRMMTFVALTGPVEFQALGVRRRVVDSYERARAAHAMTADEAVVLCTEADRWNALGVYVLPAQLRGGVETRTCQAG